MHGFANVAERMLDMKKMTFVQEATLPIILKGKDVLSKARTGMKTTCFQEHMKLIEDLEASTDETTLDASSRIWSLELELAEAL
ncbi:hypothetical protein L1987_73034 [Smallanthus sonchifolius]|uniref:Uncharacterized protein n=1 Tax=Smallanthus sonchifolius TaxID=185202 RepID=A0ACB9AX49_9ASTR|nr:hypothetical protein L1987_73034 [Smallanthus sonchifolius]